MYSRCLSFNTCSSCEEQPSRSTRTLSSSCFNTCSSCEEQRSSSWRTSTHSTFQYMLLLRGATFCGGGETGDFDVSIHAPLARSNAVVVVSRGKFSWFQYMLLLRGATCTASWTPGRSRCFNTCSSCEEQPEAVCYSPRTRFMFQYMLLLRGATELILALLARSTFQYMLLLRGATKST